MGRSESYERRLNEIYDKAIKSLIDKAKSMGANGIVGLKIDFGEVSGKGNQMFMISAVGTPVKAFKAGEEAMEKELEGFKSYDGELIERKIRAKKIIDFFNDGKFQVARLSQNSIDFIVKSGLPEFCDLVLELLCNWSFDVDAEDKLKTLLGFFKNLDTESATNSLYGFMENKEIDDSTRMRLVKIALENGLVDYSKLKPLLINESINTKKFVLDLLKVGKSLYSIDDIYSLQEYAEMIPNQFPALGTSEQVKGMFSSSLKDMWVCACGTKNGLSSTYCGRCGYDNFGFKEDDNKPNDVIGLIGQRLVVISAF